MLVGFLGKSRVLRKWCGIIIFQNASHTDREFTHEKNNVEREEGNKALESLYIFLVKDDDKKKNEKGI